MDYTKYLNDKIVGLKPSGIRKYFDIAATMPDCISLGVGEPNFVTPKEGIDGGVRSLLSGHTHYTSNGGIMELRELMSYYIHKKYALEYDPTCEILPTIGVSEAVDITMRALLNPGDEVLVS
ncbi:MAG: aminotransferase class I/II-fold pyridoxal phosphate-dependent enzyme, partial [Clostridia bacterium]|nr:aminotransferase class I/II-fold pyridoxal phosphate-dependent enzyme [Clostridia bacterium]